MKPRDLERHLRDHGAELASEGASHSVWAREQRSAAVPRHKEIKFTVVRSICRTLGVAPPRGRLTPNRELTARPSTPSSSGGASSPGDQTACTTTRPGSTVPGHDGA